MTTFLKNLLLAVGILTAGAVYAARGRVTRRLREEVERCHDGLTAED